MSDLHDSLTYMHFQGLFKECYWLQLIFLGSNYPLVISRLSFVWEWIFQGYAADLHNPPFTKPSLDEKIAWLEQFERQFGWRAIREILDTLLPSAEVRRYRSIWRRLNQHVHPSLALMDQLIDPSTLLARDAFDPKWAADTLAIGTDVFDLIWFVVLCRFPRCVSQVAREGLCAKYALTKEMLSREL